MSIPSDTEVVSAFLAGTVQGLAETPQKPDIIRSQISNIFLFPETVYKHYRRDNVGFNTAFTNLADPAIRRAFIEEDFFCDHYFNPGVYQELQGLDMAERQLVVTSYTAASSDTLIRMRRIDASKNLTFLLLNGLLQPHEARTLGFEMTKAIAEYPRQHRDERPYADILKNRVDDVEAFAALAEPLLSKERAAAIIAPLRRYVETHERELNAIPRDALLTTIDNHSDNVYLADGHFSIIDAYLPKAEWRTVERFYAIKRLMADVEILGNAGLARELLGGYLDYYGISSAEEPRGYFYMQESALIKCAYLFMIAQEGGARRDEAERYLGYLEASIVDLGA